MPESFMEQLRQPQPFPGGGAAAAHVGALALALVEKVVRIEIGKSDADSSIHSVWNARLARATALLARFRELIHEDGRAYERMSKARAQESDVNVVAEAVTEAALVPSQIIGACAEGLELISETLEQCRKYLVSDILVCAELLFAVARGAKAIAAANVELLDPADRSAELLRILFEAIEHVDRLHGRIASL